MAETAEVVEAAILGEDRAADKGVYLEAAVREKHRALVGQNLQQPDRKRSCLVLLLSTDLKRLQIRASETCFKYHFDLIYLCGDMRMGDSRASFRIRAAVAAASSSSMRAMPVLEYCPVSAHAKSYGCCKRHGDVVETMLMNQKGWNKLDTATLCNTLQHTHSI